jgi:hypothetical protein
MTRAYPTLHLGGVLGVKQQELADSGICAKVVDLRDSVPRTMLFSADLSTYATRCKQTRLPRNSYLPTQKHYPLPQQESERVTSHVLRPVSASTPRDSEPSGC